MIDHTEGHITDYPVLHLNVDGGTEPKNPGGVTCSAWVLYNNTRDKKLAEHWQVVKDGGELATNNYGEYCALGLALRWLSDQNWRGNLVVRSDSKLLVNQVLETWKCNAPHLQKLRAKIIQLLDGMELQRMGEDAIFLIDPEKTMCWLCWVPREQNTYADALCHKAFLEHQAKKRVGHS